MPADIIRSGPPVRQGGTAYRQLSLVDLIHRVVDCSDPLALHEFHERRYVSWFSSGQPLRLTDYLSELRDNPRIRRCSGGDPIVLDAAHDLTLEKFRRLPSETEMLSPGTRRPRRDGPDCRKYFEAFLTHVERLVRDTPGQIDLELAIARRLEIFVFRHFLLSCLECGRRSRRLVRRFFWEREGRSVCLRMPSYLSPAECRTWLERHVDGPDLSRAGERGRIQRIVDSCLHTPRVIRFSEPGGNHGRFPAKPNNVAPSVLQDLSARGLAEAVAREKAENIEQQRPAIRRLGKAKLEQLILCIFEGLASSDYHDESVARKVGLSKATLSRFAGSHWRRPSRRRGPAGIPDLWRNTAQVLAQFPAFADAARNAGIWTTAGQELEDRFGIQPTPLQPAQDLSPESDAAAHAPRSSPTGGKQVPATPLYFIPLIAQAMRSPDVSVALDEALTAIRELGRQEGYGIGLVQFYRFMDWAAQSTASAEPSPDELRLILKLACDWATDGPSGDTKARQAALELIGSRPEWQRWFEELCTWLSSSVRPEGAVELLIDRNGRHIGMIALTGQTGSGALAGILPGDYTLSLSTGRQIWEGTLTPNELNWTLAFPGQPLDMAAATEEVRMNATRTEELLDGELILQVFPGIARGRITVTRTDKGVP